MLAHPRLGSSKHNNKNDSEELLWKYFLMNRYAPPVFFPQNHKFINVIQLILLLFRDNFLFSIVHHVSKEFLSMYTKGQTNKKH